MSKRKKIELLIKEEEKKLKEQEKISKLMKVAILKQKEKNKNFEANDFPYFDFLEEFRDRNQWKKKSYNKEKQKEEFIKFTFFKYEMPIWALNFILSLEIIKKDINFRLNNEENESYNMKRINNQLYSDNNINNVFNLDILKSSTNGKGIKEYIGHILSNKEIHFFLTSKQNSINKAIIEAKLKKFNLAEHKLDFLINRFENNNVFKNNDNNAYEELLYFLAKNDLNINDCQEIYDYVISLNLYNKKGYVEFENKMILAKDFFKKSLSTIIELSNRFHIELVNLKNNKFTSWNKTFENFSIEDYLFIELTNNKELSKEGRTMKHCVGSYAERCFSGKTKIVSLSKNINNIFEKLVTIEIIGNKIQQCKGKCNRNISQEEKRIINLFAINNNLIY